jgi:hypothetical protein
MTLFDGIFCIFTWIFLKIKTSAEVFSNFLLMIYKLYLRIYFFRTWPLILLGILSYLYYIQGPVFHNYVHLIYPNELKIKDTTDSDMYLLHILILYLTLTWMADWQLHYMTNVMILTLQSLGFPFLCHNIPLSAAYGVYISQLIQYTRACGIYQNFSKWSQLLQHKSWCCRVITNLV